MWVDMNNRIDYCFQEGEGMREPPYSRGLGDVYKGQRDSCVWCWDAQHTILSSGGRNM